MAPLAWLVLNVALNVHGARADTVIKQFIEPLQSYGGGAGKAAQQLQVLVASAHCNGPADVSSNSNSSGGSHSSEATAMHIDGVLAGQVRQPLVPQYCASLWQGHSGPEREKRVAGTCVNLLPMLQGSS